MKPQVPTADEAKEAALVIMGPEYVKRYRLICAVSHPIAYPELLKVAAAEAFMRDLQPGRGAVLMDRSIRIVRAGLLWLQDHCTLPQERTPEQDPVP